MQPPLWRTSLPLARFNDELRQWTAGKTTRDDRHTGPITRVHTVDCGFVARLKKCAQALARDATHARKFLHSDVG